MEQKINKLEKLKSQGYDLMAAKQQIEQRLIQTNQAVAQESRRLQQIEIAEAKKKADEEAAKKKATEVKSVDQKGGVTAAKVEVKNSEIKDSNIVVDSEGSKTITPKPEVTDAAKPKPGEKK